MTIFDFDQMVLLTDYGLMIAISQTLFGQYHTWDMDKGLKVPKIGADNLDLNTPNTSKFIRTICPIGPKVWDIVEKGFIGRP